MGRSSSLVRTVLRDFGGYAKHFLKNKSVELGEIDNGVLLTSDIGSLVYFEEVQPTLLRKPELSSIGDFDLLSFQVPSTLKQSSNWIEIDTETRSKEISDLPYEFVQFVGGRYGVRITNEIIDS